jgi:predicted DNA-binding transcriptional regulator AlpA
MNALEKADQSSPYQGLRIEQVLAKVGVTRTTLYKNINLGLLPAPIKMGKASIWIESELDEALENLVKQRDASRNSGGK